MEVAHDGPVPRGTDVSDVWHGPPFPPEARQPGPDPERTSYGSFFSFDDPDGNLWLGPGGPPSPPGPTDPAGTAISVADGPGSALGPAHAAPRADHAEPGRLCP